jgi:hypothetical protein
MDHVGWGFDARFRDGFWTFKVQIMQFTFNYNANGREQLYRYPSIRTQYAVPDQVTVRTIGQTTSEASLHERWAMMRCAWDLKIGLGIETPSFAGEIRIAIGIKLATDDSSYIVHTEANTLLYQLELNTRYLTEDFLFDVEKLKGYTYQQNPSAYAKFCQLYGTHYIDAVVMGGTVVTDTVVSNSTFDFALRLAIGINAKVKSGGNSIELDLELALSIETQTITSSTISTAEVKGGDSRVGDFIVNAEDKNALAGLLATWKETVAKVAAPIEYRFLELHEVIPDRSVAGQVCLASKAFLGGEAPGATVISKC